MLFIYDKCECCKKQRNNINVELSKLLPSNICNKITENNINCDRCCLTYKKDQQFCKKYIFSNDESKFYNQLLFFSKNNKKSHLFYWKYSKTQYNKNMDKLFEDEELIKRLGDGWKNVKKYRAFAKNIVNCLYG